MYIPRPFAVADDDVRELLAHQGASDLITVTPAGLVATVLPLVFDPDAGEHGALLGHIARANDQWHESADGAEAMVIVRGPEAYISPTWYATKAEHHRVVPTWNYMIAHVYGRLVVHDDPEWVGRQIRALTGRHEAANAEPWTVEQAPAEYIAQQLKAIVGVELVISRIEAKFKLSQNQPAANVDGVVNGLRQRAEGDDIPVAEAVRKHNPSTSSP